MSTAVAPVSKPTGGKKSAETRIGDLVREVRDLEEQLDAALRENEALKATARTQEQQADINDFMSKCEAPCKARPEFDECLRRIADIPDA